MTIGKNNLAQLPTGWVWARVIDVVGNIPLTGKKLKRSQYKENGKIPVIDQGQKFIGGYTNRDEFKVEAKPPTIVFGDHTKVMKYVDFCFVE